MALVRLKTSALGAVLVTGVLALCAPELAAAADPPRYTSDQVSLEPDQEILNLRFHGGRTRTLRTYSLMGDGSLFVSTSRNASATPELVTSGQLLDEELSAVINSITRNRLYALDNEQIKARKHLEPTPGPYIADAGAVEVKVNISLFPGTAANGNDDLRSAFVVSGSDLGEGAYPSVRELAAFRQIVGWIRRAEARAKAPKEIQP